MADMASRSRTRRPSPLPSSRLNQMTKSVGVHEAKTHLSRLLQEVAGGEEIVITSRGKAVAKLGPPPSAEKPIFGMDRGRIWISPDFDAPLPDDFLDEFEN